MMGKAQEMPTARRGLITFKEGLKHLRVGRTKASELINAGKIIAYGQPKVDAFLTGWACPEGRLGASTATSWIPFATSCGAASSS